MSERHTNTVVQFGRHLVLEPIDANQVGMARSHDSGDGIVACHGKSGRVAGTHPIDIERTEEEYDVLGPHLVAVTLV